jgi:hypothetical protein
MIQLAPSTGVHLAGRPVSMRYGFDGLVWVPRSPLCSRWIRSRPSVLLPQQARVKEIKEEVLRRPGRYAEITANLRAKKVIVCPGERRRTTWRAVLLILGAGVLVAARPCLAPDRCPSYYSAGRRRHEMRGPHFPS